MGALNSSDPLDTMRLEQVGSNWHVYGKQADKDEVYVGTFRAEQGDLLLHNISGANNPGFDLSATGRVKVADG